MYSVESYPDALEQVAVLPVDALSSYAEVMALLEVAPWSGEAYNRQRPDANMRTHAFGKQGEGVVIYMVLEDQRRVVVLRVLWVT